MYQALVVIPKCLGSFVPPLPKVFYREGGQEGCCLNLFFLPLPPQRAGNKNHKSNHSGDRKARTPVYTEPQTTENHNWFPKEGSASHIIAHIPLFWAACWWELKSSHTQNECRQHHSFHAYQADSTPSLADGYIVSTKTKNTKPAATHLVIHHRQH